MTSPNINPAAPPTMPPPSAPSLGSNAGIAAPGNGNTNGSGAAGTAVLQRSVAAAGVAATADQERSSVLTMDQAKALYDKIATGMETDSKGNSFKVPYDYPDFCPLLAQYAAEQYGKLGYKGARKIFIQSSAADPSGNITHRLRVPDKILLDRLLSETWKYHVALLVSVNKNGTPEDMVVDPVISKALGKDGPLTIHEWISAMNDKDTFKKVKLDEVVYSNGNFAIGNYYIITPASMFSLVNIGSPKNNADDCFNKGCEQVTTLTAEKKLVLQGKLFSGKDVLALVAGAASINREVRAAMMAANPPRSCVDRSKQVGRILAQHQSSNSTVFENLGFFFPSLEGDIVGYYKNAKEQDDRCTPLYLSNQ